MSGPVVPENTGPYSAAEIHPEAAPILEDHEAKKIAEIHKQFEDTGVKLEKDAALHGEATGESITLPAATNPDGSPQAESKPPVELDKFDRDVMHAFEDYETQKAKHNISD